MGGRDGACVRACAREIMRLCVCVREKWEGVGWVVKQRFLLLAPLEDRVIDDRVSQCVGG